MVEKGTGAGRIAGGPFVTGDRGVGADEEIRQRGADAAINRAARLFALPDLARTG